MTDAVTLEDIKAAAERIAPHIRHTPIIRALRSPEDVINEEHLFFKLETLQVTGSFKSRGALNKMLLLPEEERAKGLVTASGGNHGKAVAYAAQLVGVPAEIYLPITTPGRKADAIIDYHAKVVTEGNILDESSKLAMKMATSSGKPYIHNFNDPAVVAGNGTVGLEILEELPDVDTVLIATGGGGLLAGCCVAIKSQRPDIKIIGVEPTGAPTLTRSLEEDKIVELERLNTRAGTLALASTASLNFEIIKKYVDGMLLVTDQEMEQASRWLWRQYSIAAELSASAPVAALQTGKYKPEKDEIICAIICGAGDDGIVKV